MNNYDVYILYLRTMDLVALQIFKTVAEEGGITRAAAKLHRVQSNVTTRVKQLEARLGTPLFLRQNRRLTLSPEGTRLLAYADQLLRLASEAEAALRDGVPRGLLRIGTLESTAATRLPPVLSRFHLAYPEVRIELVTGTDRVLRAKILNYELEAAFVAGPVSGKNLEFQPAFVEELVLIAPKSFPRIKTPLDIGRTTVIAFGAGCSYRRCLEDWLAGARVFPERVMEFNSYHAIVACVAAGSGIAMVPRSVLRAVTMGHEVSANSLPSRIATARTDLAWRKGHRSVALDAMRKILGRVARGRSPR
jgi:DNA-binding transcriptional LysR family regulator